MTNTLQIILLGITQGITEFLPISSSGHLAILQKIIHFDKNVLLVDSFLHLGTLLAILIAFRKDIWDIILKRNWKVIWILFVASIPTAIIGFGLEKVMDKLSLTFVGIGFFITAILLIIINRIKKDNTNDQEIKDLNIKDALIVGTIQGIAVLPGISRSGSTLFASMTRKLKMEEALKFSFLLAIPAILGANILSLTKNFSEALVIKGDLALGLIISCIFGIISIWMLRYLLGKSKLWYFSIYLILLGIVIIAI